ncbi:MAG TPA: MFS transporter [Terriglobales bacterium]|nr:MFS transporter [Terriglobales bacterium]
MTVSVFINYIDRGNLSIAAPMLKDELGISAAQLGLLLSAFFWTYSAALLASGWLVDHVPVKWVMAAGFFLWSGATVATGFLHGFAALLMIRLVLGIGESVAYPAYSSILANHCPSSDRSFANALVATGLACGPAFGMLLGGTLMARFGWRSYFIGVGTFSMIWLLPWLRYAPHGPGIAAASCDPAPSTLAILKQRASWGTFIGLFSNAYGLYYLIAWLPFYLVRERHFSMDTMARIGSGLFLAQAAASAIIGRTADVWIKAGAGRTKVYLTLLLSGQIVLGGCLFAVPLVRAFLLGPILLLTGFALGSAMANIWPITQTLAGPHASGRWTGIQCFFGNLAGVLAGGLTGWIVQRTGHFFWAFGIAALLTVPGMSSWLFVVRRVEPVAWGLPQSRAAVQPELS